MAGGDAVTTTWTALAAALLIAGCGAAENGASPDAPASDAELANAAALANEAAADEAADMANFGGSAAEMDRLNGQ